MSRPVSGFVAIAVLALASVPVMWFLTAAALPSYAQIAAAGVADTTGVWVFTWALVAVGMAAAVLIAGNAVSWLVEAGRARGLSERAEH